MESRPPLQKRLLSDETHSTITCKTQEKATRGKTGRMVENKKWTGEEGVRKKREKSRSQEGLEVWREGGRWQSDERERGVERHKAGEKWRQKWVLSWLNSRPERVSYLQRHLDRREGHLQIRQKREIQRQRQIQWCVALSLKTESLRKFAKNKMTTWKSKNSCQKYLTMKNKCLLIIFCY